MGRQSLLADEPSTAITMKVLLLLALAARQITGQDGHGGMGGSGMEGSGSGYGIGGYGYGMGGSGYGGEWSEWKPTGGYGGGECCPTKKIWGSMNPEKHGIWVRNGIWIRHGLWLWYGLWRGHELQIRVELLEQLVLQLRLLLEKIWAHGLW